MKLILEILSIVLIDLVLSGDNAAVIGLAIKNLPAEQRKSAAFFGAGGAIVLRVLFTVVATMLIHIPFLNAVGGVILLGITWNLLKNNDNEGEDIAGSHRYWAAVGSIVLADISMAFDNIMGVAGAAHGKVGLVILGLALSIPILVIGSNWLASLMNRFRIIIYLGGAVLIHTALLMILTDHGIKPWLFFGEPLIQAFAILAALGILVFGLYQTRLITPIFKAEAAASKKEE